MAKANLSFYIFSYENESFIMNFNFFNISARVLFICGRYQYASIKHLKMKVFQVFFMLRFAIAVS